jgi:concanavalin A-like lectin/glucanase superfamily protein
MTHSRRSSFTLIEIMITIGILIILSGMFLPSLIESKFRAKYVRWFAYNNALNRDPKLIVNFNFQQRGFKIEGEELVHNGAEGCTIEGYEPKKYHGQLKDSPAWLSDSGRWQMHNKAMLFDGTSDYIEVAGTTVFTNNQDNNDFTVICWVNFDEFSGIQSVVSRSIWPAYAQFIIYAQDDIIKAEIGQITLEYSGEDFKADQWNQVCLKNNSGNVSLYLNGKQVDTQGSVDSDRIVIFHALGSGGYVIMVASENAWNGHQNHAGDYIISTDPQAYYNSTYAEELANSKFLIGAAQLMDGSVGYYFKGRMDEVVFVKRPFKDSEINANFEMGYPY